jgi:NADPH-dependent ferric siderophore reductase
MATARGAASSDTPTYPYFRTRVVRSARLTPHLTRVTVGAPGLAGFPHRGPDQHLKLFFPRPGQGEPEIPPFEDDDVASWYRRYLALPDDVRPDMRTYTARAFRRDAAELDIDFVLHGDRPGDGGPAARWAERAAPGDPVAVLAPTPCGTPTSRSARRTPGWPVRRAWCAPCAGTWSTAVPSRST